MTNRKLTLFLGEFLFGRYTLATSKRRTFPYLKGLSS